VTFDEAINPNTVTFLVKDSFNNVITGNMQYDPVTHTATFIPAAPLLSFVSYTVTVSGVTDLVGNAMTVPYTTTFKTRGTWLQTTAADFNTGTNSGTAVTTDGGGALALAPLLQETFQGTSLSAASWTSKPWAPQGGGAQSMSVSEGILTIGGTAVLSTQSYVGLTLEGRIYFRNAPYEHFGLTTSFDTTQGNYWALFSTAGTTNTLFARVNANGVTTDVSLGALPIGFHDYKIAPTGTGFQFYIDGVLRTTINASFQTSVAMKAGLSDFNGISGQLLQAARVLFANYATGSAGTFTSMIFDAGQSATWTSISWTADVPTGTSLQIMVRAGDTPTPGGSGGGDGAGSGGAWTNWMPISSPDSVFVPPSLHGRYIQYQIILTTTDPTKTPRLYDISFNWM
jgi:hypothetical protein